MFQQYTASVFDNIYHPSIDKVRKANTDKAAYEENLHKGGYISTKKRELYLRMNVDHWQIWLLDKIEWFQFQEILEHSALHAKGDNILINLLLKVFIMFLIRLWNGKN